VARVGSNLVGGKVTVTQVGSHNSVSFGDTYLGKESVASQDGEGHQANLRGVYIGGNYGSHQGRRMTAPPTVFGDLRFSSPGLAGVSGLYIDGALDLDQ